VNLLRNKARSRLGGTRREKTAVSARSIFRFDGWFSHQAATACRLALYSDDFGFFPKKLVPVTYITWKAEGYYDELFQETI
jgi:hypothetical protein